MGFQRPQAVQQAGVRTGGQAAGHNPRDRQASQFMCVCARVGSAHVWAGICVRAGYCVFLLRVKTLEPKTSTTVLRCRTWQHRPASTRHHGSASLPKRRKKQKTRNPTNPDTKNPYHHGRAPLRRHLAAEAGQHVSHLGDDKVKALRGTHVTATATHHKAAAAAVRVWRLQGGRLSSGGTVGGGMAGSVCGGGGGRRGSCLCHRRREARRCCGDGGHHARTKAWRGAARQAKACRG